MEKLSKELKMALERSFQRSFAGIIQIYVDDSSTIWVDGHHNPPTITTTQPSPAKPLCIWRTAQDILSRILDGERALESAFVSGRLTISGDMAVMARLCMENAR